MQFNATSTKDGIIQTIESMCNLADGEITSNATLFLRITGLVNQANKKVAAALLEVDKNWNFDDSNYTDFPRGTANLVSGQRDYTLPAATTSGNASTLLKILKIAVLDKNTTPQERILVPTDLPEAELNNRWATSGLPFLYRLVGNSLKMWPAPDNGVTVTLTSGLVVYFQRTPVPFDTSTTNSVEPGFMSTFHDVLCYDVASTYLMPKNPKLAANYLQIYENRLQLLQEAYANKNNDNKNRIQTVYRNPR